VYPATPEIPNPKFQIPPLPAEIPTTKSQIAKAEVGRHRSEVGFRFWIWCLGFPWSLELGIWDLGFPFALGERLRSWMKLSMHGFQPLLVDVRINLGRRNVRVPEHFLDDPQIGAVT
jgi:hypothetical protein